MLTANDKASLRAYGLDDDGEYCSETEEFSIEDEESIDLSDKVTFSIDEHNADVELACDSIVQKINKMVIPKETQFELINTVVKVFHTYLYIEN